MINFATSGIDDNIVNLEPIPNPEVCNEDIYYYGGESSAKSLYCLAASLGLEYITSTAGNIDTFYYLDKNSSSSEF